MLLRLIEDMNHALDNDCYFAALAIALMLPDICGKAKYHKEGRDRYIDWYDEYVGQYEKCPKSEAYPDESELPYLSGEVVFKLRCAFLHQGNPGIEEKEIKKIKEERCRIDHFTLLTEKKNEFDIYGDSASVFAWYSNEERIREPVRSYEVNVRRLCLVLAACAKGYYNEFPEQFDFFNYDIVDVDERNAALRS